MKRLLGCMLLLGAPAVEPYLAAQGPPGINIESTLLALKDSGAPRKQLSNRLVDEMMALAKRNQSPSRASVQRFSEDLSGALTGRDVTKIRAAALRKAIAGVMSGSGSTFSPATSLRETLVYCGIDEPTVQQIVQRFMEIGQEVRGPDDTPLKPVVRFK